MEIKELIDLIVECAMIVRSQLTSGFEEKVYKNALYIELIDHGITVETEVPFKVYYKDHIVGDYRADMIADRRVIIELKAVSNLATIHEVQLVNYLTATGIDDGLLINFGSEKIEIRHKYRLYKKI
ncbi:MAG: GxxExxY protein [Prevotella sp.]|nr:GxxExxY protein [Prevotella sp.]